MIHVQRDPNDQRGWMVIEIMHPASLIHFRGSEAECRDYVQKQDAERKRRRS